jgi:putative FmdB family regulatory protein
MPLYEYVCEDDGAVITLMRPMAQADDPVEDPEGKGRTFARAHSTFSVGASTAAAPPAACAPCPHCVDGQCGLG